MAAGTENALGFSTRTQVPVAGLRLEGKYRRNGCASAVAIPRVVAQSNWKTRDVRSNRKIRDVRRVVPARAAGRLWRERPGAPPDSARQRHCESAGQRHTGGPHDMGGGPP